MGIEEHVFELSAGCTSVAMILVLFNQWHNPTENTATILGVDLVSVMAIVVIINSLILLIWYKKSQHRR